jgi:hypothetical protein
MGLSLLLYAAADRTDQPAFRQHNSACHDHQDRLVQVTGWLEFHPINSGTATGGFVTPPIDFQPLVSLVS